LYEHLCATTSDKHEPTLEDLQPLYQAVAHGCQAGLYEACDVYYHRIQQGIKYYAVRRLGAYASDLAVIACFFQSPWTRLLPGLTENTQAWLLNEAATRLRALGRLIEAIEPMRVAVTMYVEQESWRSAARAASNLSELALTLGKVTDAVSYGEESVAYSSGSNDAGMQSITRCSHAAALSQEGRRAQAEDTFRRAELIQAELTPEQPLFWSVAGFWYCDLLAADLERVVWQRTLAGVELVDPQVSSEQGVVLTWRHSNALHAVSRRAAIALETVAHRTGNILAIALHQLTLGRAKLYELVLSEMRSFSISESLILKTMIDEAVTNLRRAGAMHYLPHGLLTAAWSRFCMGGA
jgi:tetratricopeptide (TPR) repeat protein